MFRLNLANTTKLAYVLSIITVLFLSSAFISFANAGMVDPPGHISIDPPSGVSGFDAGEEKGMDYSIERLRARYESHMRNQQSYIDRWIERKYKYRLYEEYAAWLRDHEEPGSGNFGPPGYYNSSTFPPITVSLPTFVDMILSSF